MIIIFLVVASLAFEVKLTANSAACLIKELPSYSKYSGEVGTKL